MRRPTPLAALWALALLVTLVLAVLYLVGIAWADEARRPQAALRAGAEDLLVHRCNLWGCEPGGNVYLVAAGEVGLVPALAPPDGTTLAVDGCELHDTTYDLIQRLDPAGIVAVGSVCQAAVDEATMRPAERHAYRHPPVPAHHPEYDPARRAMWDRVMGCEAGHLGWAANTGNGYYGGLQFSRSSWDYVGGGEFATWPHQASAEHQIVAGERLLATPPHDEHWPHCGDQAGLVRR